MILFFIKPVTKGQEIVAEDDQIFLIKLRTQLNQQVPASSTVSNVAIALVSHGLMLVALSAAANTSHCRQLVSSSQNR